jgi:dihydropteroate synthase
MKLRCGKFELSLSRPLIMGIVNLTPDSFSGDGLAASTERAIAHAHAQIEAGADMLDLGAESSRPGAQPTPLVSIDTYKPEVMRAALAAGASMINDIYALRMPGAIEAVADSDCGICLMHMQGEPLTMQQQPVYVDVVREVRDFLGERVRVLEAAGVARERVVLDPGFGFGKTLDHNLALLRHLADTTVDGLPILAGLSRKSMLGAITGRSVEERLPASLAAALLALQSGAAILRVHDVAATRDTLAVWSAVHGSVTQ